MLEEIENTISRYNMLPAGIRLGVAVSGGADSVFLLHVLAARSGASLTVLHVNHGLRGAESDRDAAFVAELATGLGLAFVGHRMGAVAGNLEQYCRRERMAFFGKLIADGVVDRVATGHTASDQAETVLMRLLRGAGTTGLRGVLPVSAEGLVRPLLGVRRDEIREWLFTRGLRWREDASNLSEDFLRNRVRARLLPLMRELDAGVDGALERVAEMAAVDEDYWRGEAGAVLERIGSWERDGLVVDQMMSLPMNLLSLSTMSCSKNGLAMGSKLMLTEKNVSLAPTNCCNTAGLLTQSTVFFPSWATPLGPGPM